MLNLIFAVKLKCISIRKWEKTKCYFCWIWLLVHFPEPVGTLERYKTQVFNKERSFPKKQIAFITQYRLFYFNRLKWKDYTKSIKPCPLVGMLGNALQLSK